MTNSEILYNRAKRIIDRLNKWTLTAYENVDSCFFEIDTYQDRYKTRYAIAKTYPDGHKEIETAYVEPEHAELMFMTFLDGFKNRDMP